MKTDPTKGVPAAGNPIRILQVMKWLSSAENTGGKIRAYRVGEALSSFASVDAAGFVLPGEAPNGKEDHLAHYHRLYPFVMPKGFSCIRQVLASFAQGLSLRTARFVPPAFGMFVEKILRETRYDAIQVEELPLMASFNAIAANTPVIYSSHNVESELSYQLFSRRHPLLKLLADTERGRTAQEEKNAMARARAGLAVSGQDRDFLRRLSPGTAPAIHVLPNCASDRFQPSLPEELGKGLLTVGSFGWYPNRDGLTWFVDEVLPLLRKRLPEESIRVAGSGIGMPLQKKLARQGMDVFPDVPDMLPFLQKARLLFVPLRIGGGSRIKILEAWATGLPVVSTARGAEGLPCRHGVNMLIADDAETFAARIGRLLEDDGLCRRLRLEGLKESRHFQWSGMQAPLAEFYTSVLKNGEAGSS